MVVFSSVVLLGVLVVPSINAFFRLPKHCSSNAALFSTIGEIPPSNKLQKIEAVKFNSNYLRDPLEEELKNEEIFLNHDAVIVLKYHGSYMQDNRDNRKRGAIKPGDHLILYLISIN